MDKTSNSHVAFSDEELKALEAELSPQKEK